MEGNQAVKYSTPKLLQRRRRHNLQVSRVDIVDGIECEDVIFGIFDEQLRKIEPIIKKFYTDEALVLNQLSMNLSHYEQLDFVRRNHMASKMLIYLSIDLKIKKRFYQQIRGCSPSSYLKLRALV